LYKSKQKPKSEKSGDGKPRINIFMLILF